MPDMEIAGRGPGHARLAAIRRGWFVGLPPRLLAPRPRHERPAMRAFLVATRTAMRAPRHRGNDQLHWPFNVGRGHSGCRAALIRPQASTISRSTPCNRRDTRTDAPCHHAPCPDLRRRLRRLRRDRLPGRAGCPGAGRTPAATATPAIAALPTAVDGVPVPSLAPMLQRVTPAVVSVHTKQTGADQQSVRQRPDVPAHVPERAAGADQPVDGFGRDRRCGARAGADQPPRDRRRRRGVGVAQRRAHARRRIRRLRPGHRCRADAHSRRRT